MPTSNNLFEKCLPAIGTDVRRCGAVTACNDIITATSDTLKSIFTDAGGDYRNMKSLLVAQFEIKACGAKTNGLFDFMMANKRMMNKRLIKVPIDDFGTAFRIEPFVMADRQSVINKEYWEFENGLDPAGSDDWQIDVFSNYGLPLDARFFLSRERVYLFGVTAGGSVTRTAYRVSSVQEITTAGGARLRITLIAENASFLPAAKVTPPVTGVLVRGTANIDDFEQYCEQGPGLNPTQSVPFWIETDRWTLCTDQFYESYFRELVTTNPFFAKFGDLPQAKLNAQLAEDFQRKWINAIFWNKRISTNQTLALYRNLDNITTASATDLYLPNEGRCVGKRANAVGIYEQMAECGRVKDLQGNTLNLIELFEAIHAISRARGDQGGNGEVVELFTDRTTRANIQLAMLKYYNVQSDGMLRLNANIGETGAFGFTYDRYKLINPAGVEMRVVSHPFFDDFRAAAADAGVETAGTMIWILDFATVYPGMIDSNRVVNRTGDIKDLAKIDNAFACVMKNAIQTVSMTSLTWTAVVECPLNSLIIEGIGPNVPEYRNKVGSYDDYYGANT